MIVGVRRASSAELGELLAMDAACFAVPWTEAGWRGEFGGEGVVLLAGVPALGFACAAVMLDVCELRRIGVMAEARGRGLGRDLLLAVVAHARSLGCVRVDLEVAAQNIAALALYRAAGFAEVGRRARYYRDPPDDAVLMSLMLGGAGPGGGVEQGTRAERG